MCRPLSEDTGWTKTKTDYGLSTFSRHALTFDIEAQLPLDLPLGIPDGIAPLIGTCHSAEGDVVLVDTHAALVAFPGLTRTGQQHQSRPTGGGERERGYIF